jgi:hypothetical protein
VILPELSDSIVDWAQVVGSALGLVAIIVSFYVLWKQRRDSLRDQKFQHDLETLRQMDLLFNVKDWSYNEAVSAEAHLTGKYPGLQRWFDGEHPESHELLQAHMGPDNEVKWEFYRKTLRARIRQAMTQMIRDRHS